MNSGCKARLDRLLHIGLHSDLLQSPRVSASHNCHSPCAPSALVAASQTPAAAATSRLSRHPDAQVRHMTKEYTTRSGRPFLAANDVSLEVPANSITALLGPSGSGQQRSMRTAVTAGCHLAAHNADSAIPATAAKAASYSKAPAVSTRKHLARLLCRQDHAAAVDSGVGRGHCRQRLLWR